MKKLFGTTRNFIIIAIITCIVLQFISISSFASAKGEVDIPRNDYAKLSSNERLIYDFF